MKLFFILIILCLFSCSYPDIDSVPDFKDLKLSKEELFDCVNYHQMIKKI